MDVKSVLVTGATGFIGGRVVEKLFLNHDFRVIAGVHSWSKAARIGRFPVDLQQIDVLNKESLAKAFKGVDIIIHCASGSYSIIDSGTNNVLEIAYLRGVKHLIHLSSVAIYGNVSGIVDESSPVMSAGNDWYSKAKAQAESHCHSAILSGLPVTIIRPTIVYGPFSRVWTMSIASRLQSGSIKVHPHANGLCNLLYIDDLVDFINLSILNKLAINDTFIVNGPGVLTWNQYFMLFNDALGLNTLEVNRGLDSYDNGFKSLFLEPIRSCAKFLLSNHYDLVAQIYINNIFLKRVIRLFEQNLVNTHSFSNLRLFNQSAIYKAAKAERVIGFKPKFNPVKGISLSAKWLQHLGFNNEN